MTDLRRISTNWFKNQLCPLHMAFKTVASVQSQTLKKLGDAFVQYCLT
jgi:hypothetical protein